MKDVILIAVLDEAEGLDFIKDRNLLLNQMYIFCKMNNYRYHHAVTYFWNSNNRPSVYNSFDESFDEFKDYVSDKSDYVVDYLFFFFSKPSAFSKHILIYPHFVDPLLFDLVVPYFMPSMASHNRTLLQELKILPCFKN